VLEILENREKETVVAYLQKAKESGLLAHVEEVTTDMWTGYVEAAREVFGSGARITIDRFHVMKNFQEQMDAARRKLQRELPEEAAKALKGFRWLWLTNWENLDSERRQELREIKELLPELGKLRDLRDSLQDLFEDHRTGSASAGMRRLQSWIAQARAFALKPLESFCKTLENWLELIANYFVTRASNGRTEGFNHKLRAILWRAYGMRNFEHFRLRALDACCEHRAQ
jgi:transposase